ncbi:MAG: helix-turn-helix transcriptional regulator [Clostridiales bacterium]|nr:helix-turn-helix transcriptional regulator [Clostridiales bacterium]
MKERMYNGIEEFDKTIKETIGLRIQDSRLKNGMTGADLGAYLGVNANQISRIERGEVNLDVGKLYVICKLFNVSADYILFGEENKSITDEQSDAISHMLKVFGGN